MKLQTWLVFVATVAVLSVTPGPAVLFVLSQAIKRGASKSVWASIGILSANAVYFVVSATSLGAILVASYNVFLLIKWLGAGYLIYLGVRFLWKSPAFIMPDLAASETATWRVWRDGFVVQGSNPKALLFVTAVLPQFIDTGHSVALQVFLLGMSSVVVEFFVLFTYGQLAARTLSAGGNPRFEKITNWIAGTLLLVAGLGLARLKRT